MAPQPDCFLRHSDFISENRGFRQDALLIRRGICKNLIEFCPQALLIFNHRLRRTLLHLCQNCLSAALNIRFQPFALHAAHLDKLFQRPVQHGTDLLPNLVLVFLPLMNGEDIAVPGYRGNGNIILQAVGIPQLPKGFYIAICEGMIDLYLSGRIL